MLALRSIARRVLQLATEERRAGANFKVGAGVWVLRHAAPWPSRVVAVR